MLHQPFLLRQNIYLVLKTIEVLQILHNNKFNSQMKQGVHRKKFTIEWTFFLCININLQK